MILIEHLKSATGYVSAEWPRDLYRLLKGKMDNTAMGGVSIFLLSTLYRDRDFRSVYLMTGLACLIHPLLMGEGTTALFVWPFLVIGLLNSDEVEGDRWAILSRVSTGSQLDGMSPDAQVDNLEAAVDRTSGDIITKIQVAESAATIERDSLDRIVNMGKNDEIDILGVWKLDRLTRADPWESFHYLEELKDAGVTLYADTNGFFDWDDLNDFRAVLNQVLFARRWYERIRESAEDGQIRYLQQGRWPFGDPPFGYVKDEDKILSLTDRGAEVVPEIYRLYLDTGTRAETRRQINERLPGENELSDSRLKTVLTSELYVGDLALDEVVVNHDPALKAVERDIFQQVQQVIDENRSTPTAANGFPDHMSRAGHRFGVEFVLEHLEALTTECPKCGGELDPYGSTSLLGTTVKSYRCSDCTFQGPLLREQEFQEMHQSLPLRCPLCPRTETFDVSAHPGQWEYEYRCENCNTRFGTNLDPNKFKRAFENPDCMFRTEGPCDAATNDDEDGSDDGSWSQATLSGI
jgi:DNA invertase Pin-like site-specific DNA recombinase/DNA-directed RNA polymerase subunit RPC12/RpoP